MTVVLSENETSVFECRPDRGVESFMNMSDSAHGTIQCVDFHDGKRGLGPDDCEHAPHRTCRGLTAA